MKERLKSAIPLIILVLLAFLLQACYARYCFLLLAVGMIVTGCHEAFSMLDLAIKRPFQVACTIFALMLAALAMFQEQLSFTPAAMGLSALFLLIIFAMLFCHRPTQENLLATFASLGLCFYLVWPMLCMARLYFLGNTQGRFLLLTMIATTKMADTGAYIVGSATAKMPGGNHKLAPTISPKKSWEGLLGGTLFSAVTALLLWTIPAMVSLNGPRLFSWWAALLFGIVASVAGLLGDLAESALKRAANQKDSGHLPGIGGILDVLDSLIPVAPLFLAYVLFQLEP